MEARPEFTVIAGPNGAGKSRLCSYYIHCNSFDGDLLAKLFGGHDVADEIIEYNFNEGIKRMQHNLHLFDNITFVDGNTNFGEVVAIYIKKSAKHEVTKHSYSWFNQFFAEAFEKLRS